jgi:cytochrome c oxidase cbb3-type subunit 2
MTTGLDGTPMPSYADTLGDDERWAISYYVLSLSAWADPLTGRKLDLPPGARAALDSPSVRADGPLRALDPARPLDGTRTAGERRRVYYPGIRE